MKLRYNYELLEDEYQESCKRIKALDARIEELRKTMFLFPAGKIEEVGGWQSVMAKETKNI